MTWNYGRIWIDFWFAQLMSSLPSLGMYLVTRAALSMRILKTVETHQIDVSEFLKYYEFVYWIIPYSLSVYLWVYLSYGKSLSSIAAEALLLGAMVPLGCVIRSRFSKSLGQFLAVCTALIVLLLIVVILHAIVPGHLAE